MQGRRVDLEKSLTKSLAGNPKILWYEECGSTMDLAREQAADFSALGLIATQHQTAGRGRQGREWRSNLGAFQGTFVYPLVSEPNPAATLVVGLAVSKALTELGVTISLKWPNDIISSGQRKLGGILTEYVARPAAYLIGIGVNLVGGNAEIGSARIGTIEAEYGKVCSAVDFAAKLWSHLEANLRIVQSSGFAAFMAEWNSKAAFLGAEFSVEMGSETVVGNFQGVNETGAMLLRVGERVRALATGHIVGIRTVQNGR